MSAAFNRQVGAMKTAHAIVGTLIMLTALATAKAEPVPGYTATTVVTVPPAPVAVAAPWTPVVVAPAPVVLAPPVCVAPAPVVVTPAPVCVAPRPVVHVGIGFHFGRPCRGWVVGGHIGPVFGAWCW